ncbi:MAG: alpha/beta hydrolase [Naasia sp.]|uniref:alpha/beta fold hydrolase n=1 Tax=Naasia sp. TaxID=2546198 RepID=UPI002630E0DE|nr:alpha/beta hydrolase [Naasia sp.]MCU1570056.1 alpha/beta hydrolase [Naasia sp.]
MTATAPTADVRRRNNVHVLGAASGSPLVFAHGFGCSQEMWRHVAPAFEADHPVVLFDHVGAGNSDLSAYQRSRYDSLHGYAEDLLQILEQLDLHDVVYVGHSVSAMIGVLAANMDPSRFRALILVCPSPRYIDDDGYSGGFTLPDIESMLDALDANYLGWSAGMAPVIMGVPQRPELGAELTESFCRTEPAIARHFARVTFLSDNRRDLAAVSVPTLVLQSADDAIAPRQVGQYVHEHIPGSTLRVMPTTGHCPNLSDPELVSAEILAYLA